MRISPPKQLPSKVYKDYGLSEKSDYKRLDDWYYKELRNNDPFIALEVDIFNENGTPFRTFPDALDEFYRVYFQMPGKKLSIIEGIFNYGTDVNVYMMTTRKFPTINGKPYTGASGNNIPVKLVNNLRLIKTYEYLRKIPHSQESIQRLGYEKKGRLHSFRAINGVTIIFGIKNANVYIDNPELGIRLPDLHLLWKDLIEVRKKARLINLKNKFQDGSLIEKDHKIKYVRYGNSYLISQQSLKQINLNLTTPRKEKLIFPLGNFFPASTYLVLLSQDTFPPAVKKRLIYWQSYDVKSDFTKVIVDMCRYINQPFLIIQSTSVQGEQKEIETLYKTYLEKFKSLED